ncbi:MAG: thiamine-phosphate kinase [Pseudomonadota bacterium]
MSEFDLISRYFSGFDRDALVGVGDDAAVVKPGPDKRLVVATDTLIEGVHFPADTPADSVGFRALAVNLSDLAAMGATPRWFTLALTLPEENTIWLEGFSQALIRLADRFGIGLIGGDTTRGQLSITITAIGEADQVLTRSGAKPGDKLWIGGYPGEAAGGLTCWARRHESSAEIQRLVERFLYPEPQVSLGYDLNRRANAAIDVSDGLVADLAHLCSASQCGAEVDLDHLPLSDALLSVVGGEGAQSLALSGGDDYLLLFTARPSESFESCFVIGKMTEAPEIELRQGGDVVTWDKGGYRHF